ncbi:MAG: 8-amino-7-oxononanoate synthase [Vicinamibacterales bacterium]|nr:8-amino-7-oxononanoate synthase [Vicinamibacterales bacterium]
MGVLSRLDERIAARLAAVDEEGLRRTLKAPVGIDFSSNDYLGLSRDPRVTDRLIAGVRTHGAGSTGSRLLRGERDATARLEARFATFKGTARALYFSSGYLANLAVVATFAEPGDLIVSDALNHASLIDGIRLARAERVILPHADAGALEGLLSAHRRAGEVFVVTESLFSMDGDEAPLAAYADLCRRYGAALIVDEAHAVGVYGGRGSGLIEACGVDDGVWLSVNTAGKALGVSGAFIAGSAAAIDFLVQRARPMLFSTAAPPALADAIEAALDIVEHEPALRARVLARAAFLRARLAELGVPVAAGRSQILPVMVGENRRAVAMAEDLQAHGFDVRAVRPPTVPEGTARLRVSVNAGLSEAVLEACASAMAEAWERC